jgi:CubicO group peptidase (beta-lactamase class C family)
LGSGRVLRIVRARGREGKHENGVTANDRTPSVRRVLLPLMMLSESMTQLQSTIDAILKAGTTPLSSAENGPSGNGQADVPAAGVAAFICRGRETLYHAAHGVGSLESDKALAVDDLFYTASMTKAVTGAAVMQLAEQGRLSLDAPAADVLPELADIQVLEGFGDAGEPRLRAPKSALTLRQLLTHTAGFGYDLWNQEILDYQRAKGLPDRGNGDRADLLRPLLFDPGERWNYSIAIDWAGLMLEEVTGQSLGAYMQDHLFAPIGMSDTAFSVSPAKQRRQMTVHRRQKDGSLVAGEPMPPQPSGDMERGGGGLFSTVADYGAFMRMILNKGSAGCQQVLRPETVALMSQNHICNIRVTPTTPCLPAYSNDFDVFPGLPKAWGLSFLINLEQAPTGRSAGSMAWAGLTNCYYWIDPVKDVAGVFASQTLPFFDKRAVDLFLAMETAVYDEIG